MNTGQGIGSGVSGGGSTNSVKRYFLSLEGDRNVLHDKGKEPDSIEFLVADLSIIMLTVNGIKTVFNQHCADDIIHSAPDGEHIIIAPDAINLETLIALIEEIKIKANAHFADAALDDGIRVFHKFKGNFFELPDTIYSNISELIKTIDTYMQLITSHDDDIAHDPISQHPFILTDLTYVYGNIGLSWFVNKDQPLNSIIVSCLAMDFIKATFYFD